uniref:Reverse transcriptase n=1 Tax=Ascaris lumbricoides TaxID=6252 RepID=A0A0M3III2_ASCLU
MGTHRSPRLNDDEVINGPKGHESDPVHVVRAPRTLHPRRLELPIGVNNLGEASQLRQDSALAEEAQLESTENRNDGRCPPWRGGRKLWSEREIATLRRLCEAYENKQVCWKEVQRKFADFHEERTVAALATKWGALKRSRALMVGAPPTPDHDPEHGPAGEGDGGTTSQEDVPTDDPIPANDPTEGKESDVRPAVACRCAEPEEQLMESDVRPPAVVRLADPEQHTTKSGVKPVALDGYADLEERPKEKDIEQMGVDF